MSFDIRDGAIAFPYHETLGIFDGATSTLIGVRTLDERVVDGKSHGLTIVSWLADGWRGKGLGTEELRALLEFAHTHLAIAIVAAGVEETNVAAQIQHRAAGFRDVRHPPAPARRRPDRSHRLDAAHPEVDEGPLRPPARRAKIVYAPVVAEILAVAYRIAATFEHAQIGTEDLALACVHQEIRDQIDRDLPTFTELADRLGWRAVRNPNVNVDRPLGPDVGDVLGEVVRVHALREKFPVDGHLALRRARRERHRRRPPARAQVAEPGGSAARFCSSRATSAALLVSATARW